MRWTEGSAFTASSATAPATRITPWTTKTGISRSSNTDGNTVKQTTAHATATRQATVTTGRRGNSQLSSGMALNATIGGPTSAPNQPLAATPAANSSRPADTPTPQS